LTKRELVENNGKWPGGADDRVTLGIYYIEDFECSLGRDFARDRGCGRP